MCLAIPGRVDEITEEDGLKVGRVNFGGVVKRVCLDYVPEIEVGDYTVVHVGFAISKIDAESAENTRAAIPGVPAMPSPTTATTAIPGRAVTSSTRPVAISCSNARRTASTARGASSSASVKPIELSDEAWKIVETDRRYASTAANVRAAMPWTPAMPRPATVTIA